MASAASNPAKNRPSGGPFVASGSSALSSTARAAAPFSASSAALSQRSETLASWMSRARVACAKAA